MGYRMTAVAIRPTGADLDTLLDSLRQASSLGDLTEMRARIEAARAWAKVHNQVKEMRLDLLKVEVEALVRVVDLGGLDTLPARDRRAASHLASLTPAERSALVEASGNATTAAGMCRTVWMEQELAEERAANRTRGIRFAERPTAPNGDLVAIARARVADVSAVLANVVESHADTAGPTFTVDQMADEVINEAALGDDLDPAVKEGVREVCRRALRQAPVVEIDGTRLPRVVTARDEAGNYIRIPVENALLSHFDDMRAMRLEQIQQDQAALEVLDGMAQKLRQIPGADDASRIGDLVAKSLLRRSA